MYSSDPTSPDYVEDYDYFEVKRRERLNAIFAEKKQVDAAQRFAIKTKALQWRDNGTRALEAVKSGVTGLRFLLEPHYNMKKTVSHFERCIDSVDFEVSSIICTRHTFPFANQLLYCCLVQEGKKKFCRNKSNLIEWKFALMHEIRSSYIASHPLVFEYHPAPTWVRVLRILFRIYMNNIPIQRVVSEELKKKRKHFRVVCDKLQLILDTQRACDAIAHCKSRQHTNPNGCTSCGVQYIGGMLDGGTPYVHSKSRDTGLVSLVTLDFEIETLKQEEIVQREIVDQVGMDLRAFEDVVCGIVLVNIQVWWPIVLAWKRCKRKQARVIKSHFLHRRRRLVALKRDVDRDIKEAPPLDIELYRFRYWDVLNEMYEYTEKQTKLKNERLLKWARCFRGKLGHLVDEARERQYQEYLRLLALPKPPRPIVFRTLEKSAETNFVCYRLECKMRKFLTKERYDIHMNTHYKQDSVRYERYARDKAAKMVRDAREKVVLHRIKDSKIRLEQTGEGDSLNLTSPTNQVRNQSQEHTRSSIVEGSVESLSDDDYSLGGSTSGVVQDISQITIPSQFEHQTFMNLSNASDSNTGEILLGKQGNIGESGDDTSSTAHPVIRGTGYAKRKELQTDYSPQSSVHQPDTGIKDTFYNSGGLNSSVSEILRGDSLRAADRRLKGIITETNKLSLMNSMNSQRDSKDAEMNFASTQTVQDWASMAHIYTLHNLINNYMYSLELVSKQGDVVVAQRVPLDRPLIRIGTHSSCECVVGVSGASRKSGKVGTVHCLLYCPAHTGSSLESKNRGSSTDALTIVDNSSSWGTYVVSSEGTRKVPAKVTAGLVLTSGLLVCIGVRKDGPPEISATEANQACVVYRVRCMEQEAV